MRDRCFSICLMAASLTSMLFSELSVAAGAPDSQRVLSSSQSGITIEFSVDHWSRDTLLVDNQPMLSLGFPDASFDEVVGYPRIPQHVAIVAIPVGASVRSQIVERTQQVETDVILLPFPEPEKRDGEFVEKFSPLQEVYNSQAALPRKPVLAEPPGWLRDQQFVRVEVAAAQYLPASRSLVMYKRVVVRLDFDGGVAAAPVNAPPNAAEEQLYRDVLLNYQQARTWRQPRARRSSLAKTTTISSTAYVLKIKEEGIYKIDGRFLESNIAGLDLGGINPDAIRLFNNGGRELPRNLLDSRPSGLVENAILVNDGGDGRFDRDDYFLFYGRGVEGWEYDAASGDFKHYINHYGFENSYMLTLDGQTPGKRIPAVASATPRSSVTETYQGMFFLEEEISNPVNSGLNWFGRNFANNDLSRNQSWNVPLPNATSGTSQFRFRFASLNQNTHRFDIFVNGAPLGTSQFVGSRPSRGIYLNLRLREFNYLSDSALVDGANSIQLTYSHTSDFGQAFLDWFEILYPAKTNAVDNELFFSVFPAGGLETYRVSNFDDSDIKVFDVTDFANVRQITNPVVAGGAASFTVTDTDGLPNRYAAVGSSAYKSVSSLERLDFTDLRASTAGAQFVIITHDDFVSEALRLQSFRMNGSPVNRLSTRTVRVSDIYDNFSSGMVDPIAIRDFLKFTFDNWNPRPAYVLLMGDGDYDFKNRLVRTDANWIPTFQSDEIGDEHSTGISELVTRTSDSFFTYLTEDDYRSTQNPSPRPVMDMAIGRLNVQTIEEAQNTVDKIISYESQPLRGNWRNVVTMVGDDEFVRGGRATVSDVVHINQTEEIATTRIPRSFDVAKVYLSEFPKVVTASSGGITKPAAKEALIRKINQGTLIVNYIGHGNSTLWAHELVFEQADNIRVQNQGKLIFFVAATCDWALYDNPQRQSQAEELMLLANRGAIAMVSSARLVFSDTNFRFNKEYYRNLFNESGATNRIGDAFVRARIFNSSRVNDEKYHVYGDPTLRLAVPELTASITSLTPDSILALATMAVEGEIGQSGQLATDFSGTALVTARDSRKKVDHLTEVGITQTYFLPGNSIYRGTVPVTGGKFKARFVVPKDLSYGGKLARISAYFWNESNDGAGFRDSISVSSTSSSLVDPDGPEINIFFKESPNFTTGDILGENVTMVVELADTVSGINIAGEIGHQLTLSIDPDEETCLSQLNRFNGIGAIDLTDLFRFDEGDPLRGSIEFPLQFPEEVQIGGVTVPCQPVGGEEIHTLVIKAWDNSNNSSNASVEVRIAHEQGVVLREVMNYPNPFAGKTTFTFLMNQDARVTIKIYTVSGQLIKTVEYDNAVSGFNMVDWDGLDDQGDIPANGVYLYKIIASGQSSTGEVQNETTGRLAIIR